MRINNNIMALNAHRQLAVNQTNASKSMERLSSGMRINRAGDDAAGLAISEKMRGQIRGLKQASRNAQDGISLIQTAEGALNESHAILQRMRELAVQSATDTNVNVDRNEIQKEVDQLAKELTRISNTTEFNTQNLLAGGLSNRFHIGANQGQNVDLSIGAMDAMSLGVADSTKSSTSFLAKTTGISSVTNASRGLETGDYKIQTKVTAASLDVGGVSKDIQHDPALSATLAVTNDDKFTGTTDATYVVQVASVSADAAENTVASIRYSTDDGLNWKTVTGDLTTGVEIDGMKFTIAAAGAGARHTVNDQYSFSVNAAKAEIQLTDSNDVAIGPAQTVHNGHSSAKIGSNGDGKTIEVNFEFSKLTDSTAGTNAATFSVRETSSSKAQIVDGRITNEAFTAAGVNVSSQGAADQAITKINSALENVSAERSKLGAMQNRLEHTIANLGTSAENLQAAEARIRDLDMAEEIMAFTKNNILQQAATAMLAQANMAPQSVLQLLG